MLVYLFLFNAAGFALMLADKYKARKNLRRIPEATLLLVAVFGGSIGSLLGMYAFRHKTKHLRFSVGIPAILALQVITAILLFTC